MARRTVKDVPATPHFDFVYGAFRLWNWKIPYFSTTMTLESASKSLEIATDFPGAEEIHWRIEELYQREIDWPRVERKIVPYLRASNKPQFFNSLTVALLPLRESEMLESFTGHDGWTPPKLDEPDRFAKQISIGPVSCGYWEDWDDISSKTARTGQIRWNPSEVFSVAIDGQHRLAAIQRLGAGRGGLTKEQLESTDVPVIILVLDRDLGYSVPAGNGLVDVLRILFVDLNKHAKTVSRARQILLDDRDPIAVSVRAVLGNVLGDRLDELTADPPQIPLGLVDWHTEQAKFDEGPYLSTVLGLDWVVSRLLGTKPIADYTEYRAVRGQVRALESSLGIDLSAARERLNDLERIKLQPFSYTENDGESELDVISSAFKEKWNPAIVHVLSELDSYKELIAELQGSGIRISELSAWYQLYYRKEKDKYAGRATDEYRQFIGRVGNRSVAPIGESDFLSVLAKVNNLKSNDLAFNVVFQRALFLALNEVLKIRDSHLEELADDDEEDDIDLDEEVEEIDDDGEDDAEDDDDDDDAEVVGVDEYALTRAKALVSAVNKLTRVAPTFLDDDCLIEDEDGRQHRLWQGTVRKPESGIDFTLGASKRAAEILFWVAAMRMYDDTIEVGEDSDFDDLWADVLDGDSSIFKRLRRSVRRFSEKDTSAGGRIVKARGDEFSLDSSREEGRLRMAWLWRSLRT